uniref:Uncharacterized protein n=1 Tax=Anguilla anguilla TaxID=7936 RepID=A0A0E9R1Z2_ANGAN
MHIEIALLHCNADTFSKVLYTSIETINFLKEQINNGLQPVSILAAILDLVLVFR